MRTLTVVPAGLLSFNYDVTEGGTTVGSIENRAAFLQIKGTLTAGGKQFFSRREGAFRTSYLLETAEGTIASRADRKMALSEEYEISFGDRSIRLKKKSLALKETFIISDASGGIGTIVQESLLSRRLLCKLDTAAAGLPQEIVLFLAWLALIIRRKDSSSAG
jgi:hypothetical protein